MIVTVELLFTGKPVNATLAGQLSVMAEAVKSTFSVKVMLILALTGTKKSWSAGVDDAKRGKESLATSKLKE